MLVVVVRSPCDHIYNEYYSASTVILVLVSPGTPRRSVGTPRRSASQRLLLDQEAPYSP